jgi:hypothetical protein
MKTKKYLHIVFVAVVLEIASLISPSFSYAANLTTTKDTLSTSRVSFAGKVASPTVAGSPNVWIANSGATTAFPSVSTAGLKPGDSVRINVTSYTITQIISDTEFVVSTPLAAADAAAGVNIYFSSTPTHVISFKPATAVTGGFFRVLIPSSTISPTTASPDGTGFTTNGGTPTVTGTNISGYTFSAGVATASGATGCTSPANFHCFEVHYIGNGGTSTAVTITISGLLAPANSNGATMGVADSYTYIVQQFANTANPLTDTPIDDTTAKLALIEPVLVSATVDPAITFKVEGVNTSTAVCDGTTNVTTTATAIPFGSLLLDTFKWAAQKLTVSTNAASGYAVTSVANAALTMYNTSNTIPFTTCNATACTTSAGQSWTVPATYPGFGFTMAAISGATVNPISALYEPLSTSTPTQIMSNTGVASSNTAYACYKITVPATQIAGDYENQITYTATASF